MFYVFQKRLQNIDAMSKRTVGNHFGIPLNNHAVSPITAHSYFSGNRVFHNGSGATRSRVKTLQQ